MNTKLMVKFQHSVAFWPHGALDFRIDESLQDVCLLNGAPARTLSTNFNILKNSEIHSSIRMVSILFLHSSELVCGILRNIEEDIRTSRVSHLYRMRIRPQRLKPETIISFIIPKNFSASTGAHHG